MKVSSEVKLEKIRARTVIIAVIYSIIVLLWITVGAHLYYAHTGNIFRTGDASMDIGIRMYWMLIFVPTFLTALLPRRLRLRPAELAFILAMVSSSIFLGWVGPRNYPSTPLVAVYQGLIHKSYGSAVKEYISDLWIPKDTTIMDPIFKGAGAPVPWAEWTIHLLFWIAVTLSFQYFFMFGAALLRRQYIDVESLNFPIARTAAYLITQVESEEGNGTANLFKNKLFWIGVLITLICHINNLIDYLYPSFGEEYSVPLPNFSYDFTAAGITSTFLALYWQPFWIGFALILPRAVNFSYVLWQIIVYIIIASILLSMGEPLHFSPFSDARKACAGVNSGSPTFPLFGYMLNYGLLIALCVWPIWQNRDIWAESIRRALRGEKDPNEPLSYRQMWLGWCITGLISTGLLALLNIPIHYALLGVAWLGLYSWTHARMQAEVPMSYQLGMNFISNQWTRFPDLNLMIATGNVTPSPTSYNWYPFIRTFIGPGNMYRSFSSMQWCLDTYKVGSLTKARNKDIFLGQFLGITFWGILIWPVWLYLAYTIGWRTSGPNNGMWGQLYAVTQIPPSAGPAWANMNMNSIIVFITGFIIGAAILALRARFGGFLTLLSPAGMVLAAVSNRWLFACILALIINYVVVKIGGTRLYVEKVMPIAYGMLIGYAIWYIPGTIYLILTGGLGYTW
mgnify:CR=1 FL=1